MSDSSAKTLGVVLFPGFELLDVFGPVEMFGNMKGVVDVRMLAERRGAVTSAQGVSVNTDHGFADCPPMDMLLIPGGVGTIEQAENATLIDWLRERSHEAELVMTVCTGTALLARTGVLDGRRATTNKMRFQRVAGAGPNVEWVKEARWVEDGKFFTSSGVSAGIDMALAAIERIGGTQVSEALALATEYDWHRDPGWDPFARAHGLV